MAPRSWLARSREALQVLIGTRTASVRNEAAFEAGSLARRTLGWRPPTVSPNGVLGSLGTIRDRSRAATRNNPYGKGVIEKLVTNLIGTGIKPLSQAPDAAFRQQVHALFLRWSRESDADGLLDFYGQQAQAVRGWLSGGEAFGRMRPRLEKDRLSVPLQVQVLEAEYCPHTHNVMLAGGTRVRAGIEFDALGRRAAYYLHPSRPELDDYDQSQLRRQPAEWVLHLYEPTRAGQLRGEPLMTAVLVKLHSLDKFDDAVLLRQEIGNLFAMFIKRDPGPTDLDQIHPLTGVAVSDPTAPLVQMEPGTVQELNPGEDVEFADPPDPPTGLADFMRGHLRAVAVGAGVPYEVLTGDMAGINDRTVRVVLNEFKRRMQMLQYSIVVPRFCQPIWNEWFDSAVLSGALQVPAAYWDNPAPWREVKWMPQRWAYIHPVQDIEAQKEEVRAGFTSRAAIVSENGEDAEAIDEEQRLDNERADRLGLTYSSDARFPSSGAAASSFAGDPPVAGAMA